MASDACLICFALALLLATFGPIVIYIIQMVQIAIIMKADSSNLDLRTFDSSSLRDSSLK